MDDTSISSEMESVGLALVPLLLLGTLSLIVSPQLIVVCASLTLLAVGYVGLSSKHWDWSIQPAIIPDWIPSWIGFLGGSCALLLTLLVSWQHVSLYTVILSVGLGFLFVYVCLVLPLSLYDLAEQDNPIDIESPVPTVSIIIPAYNEQGYIGRCLDAVLAAEYPSANREIIVVDDGSTDGTYQEANQYRDEGVIVTQKENGGKYSALNYGLLFATGDIIVTIDADSRIEHTTLRRIVGTLQANPALDAVAGTATIANRTNLLTWCQAVEYILGFNTFRRAFSVFGAVPVIPGCLGAFRRDVVDECGTYDPDTLTEDFDLTVKILKAGGCVRQCGTRVRTEAPSTWRDLYRQRLRWYRGDFMTLLKHHDVFTDSQYGFLHACVFPFRLLSRLCIPLVELLVLYTGFQQLISGNVMTTGGLALLYISLQSIIAALIISRRQEDYRLIAAVPVYLFIYKPVIDIILLKSMLDVLVRDELAWTSPTRVRDSQTL